MQNTAPSGLGGIEVPGDRVRCDVRYQELKCRNANMERQVQGNAESTSKSE
jgi:hypothetical protein